MIRAVRRRRGAVRARLTYIEKDIVKLEDKSELPSSDQRKIKRRIERGEEVNKEFEQLHLDQGLQF